MNAFTYITKSLVIVYKNIFLKMIYELIELNFYILCNYP